MPKQFARKTITFPLPSFKLLSLLAIVFLSAIIGLSSFYLFSPYSSLVNWYLGLNRNIPYKDLWTIDFFTPATYSKGRLICIASLALGVIGIIGAVKLFRKQRVENWSFKVFSVDLLIVILLMLYAAFQGILVNKISVQGLDETYSAYYIATLHPFQTVSYYMDTNNHVFYNIINNVVFHFATDKIFTGRLIAVISYMFTTGLLYLWLQKVLNNRLLGILFTVVVTYQLTSWGFAGQGRGYTLYMFFQWLAFIALWFYLQNKATKWLVVLSVALALGFFTMPTFLYCYAALLGIAILFQLSEQRFDKKFAISNIAIICIIFIMHVPIFLFSGVGSITSNKHVVPDESFNPELFIHFRNFIYYCYWDTESSHFLFYLIVFLLPLCLAFFYKEKSKRILLFSHLTVFPAFIIISLLLKKYGFLRSIIWQENLYLLLSLLCICWVCEIICIKTKLKILFIPSMSIFLLIFCFYEMRTNNSPKQDYYLFGLSQKLHVEVIQQNIASYPDSIVLYCPNFAIMWYLEAKKKGLKCSIDTLPDADYMIRDISLDKMPMPNGYRKKEKIIFYEVYERTK